MKRTNYEFYEKLGRWESGDKNIPDSKGNYKSNNQLGCYGKYQMDLAALTDAGYRKDGRFVGKDGVWSIEDFKNNPQAQEKAVRIFHEKKWAYVQSAVKKKTGKDLSEYIGKTINGIPITPSGILAAAHLIGEGRVAKYLYYDGKQSEEVFDGFGTHIEEYMAAFADYNVSDITGIPYKSYALEAYMKKDIRDRQKAVNSFSKMSTTPFQEKNVTMNADKLDKQNEEFLNKVNNYYEDLEAYAKDKYKDCKGTEQEKGGKRLQYVKPISFEQYKASVKQNEIENRKNKSSVVTGGASSVYNTISNNSDDPLQLYTKNDNEKTSSQKLADGIDNDEWDDNDIAFLEAFLSDEKDKHLIKQAKENRKQRVKDKGNKGKGPNGEDGYWYTTKQGKHVFVPDDKTA